VSPIYGPHTGKNSLTYPLIATLAGYQILEPVIQIFIEYQTSNFSELLRFHF